MNLYQTTITTITTCLLAAAPSHGFEVISAEDVNLGGFGTRTITNLSKNAEVNFISKLTTDVGTENFESYSWHTATDLGINFPGAGKAILGGNGLVRSIQHLQGESTDRAFYVKEALDYGRYASSGHQFWNTSAKVGGSSTFSVNMSQNIAAFGFYAYDLGDFGGELAINLYQDDVLVGTINNKTHNLYKTTVNGAYTGSAVYVGIIGEEKEDGTYETFNKVEFVIVNATGISEDIFAFDDMTIATPLQVKEILSEESTLFPD